MWQLLELMRNLNVFRFLRRKDPAHAADRSATLPPTAKPQDTAATIVAHASTVHAPAAQANPKSSASAAQTKKRRLPASIQVSMLGIALIGAWWLWPLWANADRPFAVAFNLETAAVAPENNTEPDPATNAALRATLQTLAIVNPDNLPRPEQGSLRGRPTPESSALVPEPTPTTLATTQAENTRPGARTAFTATVTATAGDSTGDAPGTSVPDASADEDATGAASTDQRPESAEPEHDARILIVGGDGTREVNLDAESGESVFPEVGESDSDALTPFLVEVEIPGASAGIIAAGLNGEVSPTQSAGSVQAELILLPTATPLAASGRLQAQAAQLPRVEIIPAVGVRFTPTAQPSPTVTPSPTPTPIPSISGRGRIWSTFTPAAPPENDHYWIGNPFVGISANRSASPSYQFGSTAGNRYRPHHGIDISNPNGTPVRAGVLGEVVHAGPDDPELLGPYNMFYGNTVVILLDQRLPVAGGALDVYVLYAHLSEVRTTVGERVEPNDIVGLVGMTGIAIGPHLHVEVRLGANTYDHTVNPYLWLEPPPSSGTVAVRVLTVDGRTWAGAKVSIARFDGGAAVWARQIETYLDTENIGPDPAWGENGAMGDVPAGSYYLIANIEGENIRAEFEVKAGETTFIEVRTQQ